jgi:hypothetical protein
MQGRARVDAITKELSLLSLVALFALVLAWRFEADYFAMFFCGGISTVLRRCAERRGSDRLRESAELAVATPKQKSIRHANV